MNPPPPKTFRPKPTLETEIAGEPVWILADRALFWPARHTLVISDLHLGKDQTMRAQGIPMVEGCLDHDLARLSALIEQTDPARVLITGDLVHAPAGLSSDLLDRVAAWRHTVDAAVWLVPGNHDRSLARFQDAWKLTIPDIPLAEGPFTFFHFPAEFDDSHTICGHLHPVINLRTRRPAPRPPTRRFAGGGGAPLRLHCFWSSPTSTVLPAFGSFISGAPIDPEPTDRVFALAEGCVVEVPPT